MEYFFSRDKKILSINEKIINLSVGQILYVNDEEYEVKDGDTLTSIAQNNNITIEKLITDNNLDDVGKICNIDKLSEEENCDVMNCEENSTCQKIGTVWYCCKIE